MNMKSFVSTLVLCTILFGLGEAQVTPPPGPETPCISCPPGPAGPKGDVGELGSPGEPGHPGEPGVPGEPGEPGQPGFFGPKGMSGDPGRDGIPGERGVRGPSGRDGSDGRDGREGPPGIAGPTGARGQRGQKGSRGGFGGLIGVGPIGRPGDPGQRGPRGSKGDSGNQGASYIHWGGGVCPNSTLLLYSGYGFSSRNDLLCFTSNAEYFEDGLGLLPKGFEMVTITNISCAVCYAADKATVFTLPGSPVCPEGWNQEYSGYVVSEPFEGSQQFCIDRTPETLMNIQNGAILPITVVNSGLHPTYEAGRLLTCSVCSS